MKKGIIAFTTCFILTKTTLALDISGIHLDNNIPENFVNAISADIHYLQSIKNIKPDAEFLKILNKQNLSDEDFVNLLTNKIKYITGESFGGKMMHYDDDVMVKYPNIIYKFNDDPNNPFNPLYTPPNTTSRNGTVSNGPSPSITVMSNTGASGYNIGKKNGKLVFAKLFDGTRIDLTSPNVGLIKIGEGLFKDSPNSLDTNLNTEVKTLRRLKTYFHESRHNYGNGMSLSMSHQLCPDGHPMQGNFACDASLNGSYTFGAYALKTLISASTTLTIKDRESFLLLIAEQFGRIVGITEDRIPMYKEKLIELDAKIVNLSVDPVKNASKIQNANNYKKTIDIFLANPNKYKIFYWDDKPEELTVLK